MNWLDEQSKLVENAINNQIFDLDIYEIHGLTSPRTQTFLNKISKSKKVLELGCFCGACTTAMALSAKNVLTVDNWNDNEVISLDKKYKKSINNPKNEFHKNIERFSNVNLISKDIFSKELFVELNKYKFDIIFYDGPHEIMDIVKFILLYESLLERTILVFDDYNFDSVKEGIFIGLQHLQNPPKKDYIIETNGESKETFWNGLGIFIFE